MVKTIYLFILLLLPWRVTFANLDSDISLPGENLLGQTTTECDEGRNNNDPRRAGKESVVPELFDPDPDAGSKTIGL